MAYRIFHIPTGLYYIPSRRIKAPGWPNSYIKSNLSKTGKSYTRKPSLKMLGRSIYNHIGIELPENGRSPIHQSPKPIIEDVVEGNWLIVEDQEKRNVQKSQRSTP